jgi:protein-S-isoprenylcysteine O-methyltransferase Ste14
MEMASVVPGLVPLQLIRIRNERRVLEEKFGDEHREYRAHVVLRQSTLKWPSITHSR